MAELGAHHVRIRFVLECDQCGEVGEVETIADGTQRAEEHERLMAEDTPHVGGLVCWNCRRDLGGVPATDIVRHDETIKFCSRGCADACD